ncbi:EamA/RhaT family transporter [Puteibacter caeruleilacunae]|nr:EamA/RhaT family transporter [Puteibacter caeruleilacunae]
MIYLCLSILSSTFIFLIFKYIERFNQHLLYPIIINYLTAFTLGVSLLSPNEKLSSITQVQWLPIVSIIGVAFIVMFILIGKSTQQAGITPTTIATKLSMVIPICYSLLYFDETLHLTKLVGIIMACLAVILTIYKKERVRSLILLLFPLIIFIGSGSVDSLIKYAQHYFLKDGQVEIFSTFTFLVAFISGILLMLILRMSAQPLLRRNTITFGIALGIANFGSLYFFLKTLNTEILDSSVIFGVNNMGIVVLSVLFAKGFFKEKLNLLNWIGIIISLISIFLLTKEL